MTALVIALFVAVAAIVVCSLAVTLRQFGRRALAIRGQLAACNEAAAVRVTFRERPVRRMGGTVLRARTYGRWFVPANIAALRSGTAFAEASLRRATLLSRGVSQSFSAAASQFAGDMRQVARFSYDTGFARTRLRLA